MHLQVTEPTAQPVIVATCNNEARRQLDDLDAEAAKLIRQMNDDEKSLRSTTADMIVAGVQMAEIMEADHEAWDEFVRPFDIRTKGRDRQYRQIAGVLFRKRTGQRKMVRSQESRVGAAIHVARQWHRDGTELDKLKHLIVSRGCVDGLSKLRRDQLKQERNSDIAPSPKLEAVGEIIVPVPNRPVVIVLLPNGTTRAVPQEVAAKVFDQMGIIAETSEDTRARHAL